MFLRILKSIGLIKRMDFFSEQQKEIVLSNERFKLINGCAGSRKTDTLVKCAIHDLETNQRPILFITLASSVTFEIKTRMENYLSISINKLGQSNHYYGEYNKIPICISNYDAWVYYMLSKRYDVSEMHEIREYHSKKVEILLELTSKESIPCYMRKDTKAGLLILDEAQDICSNKMSILTNLAIKNDNLDIFIAGDYLQTIFVSDVETHSMNLFKMLTPKYFDLNICKRCPKAHIDFNNCIMKTIQKKYDLPIMLSDNENNIDKPVLFTHGGLTKDGDVMVCTLQIVEMIEKLLDFDDLLKPSDIVFIMAKSKENKLFQQLMINLNELYEKRGWKDSIEYMTTEADGYHNTLNWNKCENKSVLISIHGDKGKGHKAVFFLGLTENSIPRENHIFKPSEIISESLLNVAITRSLKYLFIGFNNKLPSRYLMNCHEDLPLYCYCSWNLSYSMPEPYFSILNSSVEFEEPIFDRFSYKDSPVLTGINSVLEVSNNISIDFENINEIVNHSWKTSVEKTIIGTKQIIPPDFGPRKSILLGKLTELLIQRKTNKIPLFNLLSKFLTENIVEYSDDDIILSFMSELKRLRNSIEFAKDYLFKYRYAHFFLTNPLYKHHINNLIDKNKIIIHSIFKTSGFKADLEEFLSEKENNELETVSVWNVLLLYQSLFEYIPGLPSLYGFLQIELKELHQNIEIFIENYITKDVVFEKPVYIIESEFLESELKILNIEKHTVGISGRIDVFELNKNYLFEIKASNYNELSERWLIQTVVYQLLLYYLKNIKTERIFIVNLVSGVIWSWDVKSIELPSFDKFIDVIGKKYDWHNIEKNKLKSKKQIQEIDEEFMFRLFEVKTVKKSNLRQKKLSDFVKPVSISLDMSKYT